MENRCAFCLLPNGHCGQATELKSQADYNIRPPKGIPQMPPDAWSGYRVKIQALINQGSCQRPDELRQALAETPEVLPSIT